MAELFDELVGKGELPDEPALRKHFETARALYRTHLRPLLLRRQGLNEAAAAGTGDEHPFRIDDRLLKTLLLGPLVPDVPALHNLTAAKLHALNYGSIASPLPGMEPQIVLGRLRDLATEAPEIRVGEGPDPVTSRPALSCPMWIIRRSWIGYRRPRTRRARGGDCCVT